MMNDHEHLNDRDLTALAAEIDRLAFQDRGDAELEARIFAATLPMLQSAGQVRTQQPLKLVGSGPVRVAVVERRESRVGMKIAAGFAIAATAALAWMGTHRPSRAVQGPHSIASIQRPAVTPSVDEWAIASAVFDDGLNDEIDNLAKATSTLRSDLDTIGTGESYEEAM
jgi:hypothetical protein